MRIFCGASVHLKIIIFTPYSKKQYAMIQRLFFLIIKMNTIKM